MRAARPLAILPDDIGSQQDVGYCMWYVALR
jgi:hypothetical protein